MFHVPVTFFYGFEDVPDAVRAGVMQEFADNGAKHLVLTDALISQIMGNANLPKKLHKEMADAGLTFVDAHAPFQGVYDPIYPDAAYRPQMINRLKLCLQICQEMGVDTCAVHIGNDFFYPEIPLEKHLDNISDALEQVLPVAEAANVTICIENIWVRSNVSPVLLQIKKRFPTPYLGLCYDSGHALLMEEGFKFDNNDVNDLWRKVGCEPQWQKDVIGEMLPEIVNCHLHDNTGQFDSHLLPGRGAINWTELIPRLKTAPKLKNIQFEVVPGRNNVSIRSLVGKAFELGEL